MKFKNVDNTYESKSVAVIGLGYVGLPLSLLLIRKGFKVTGIENNPAKVNSLNEGYSHIADIDNRELIEAIQSGKLCVTTDYKKIKNVGVIIICVPTPITLEGKPDLTSLEQACLSISAHLQKGQLVVLESSTYPSTTNTVVLPLLEKEDFKAGKEFFLSYSPERIDPGNAVQLEVIPKIVSGVTSECKNRIANLYSTIFSKVITLSSTEAAEITKLLENSYRFINITFINQFAMLCDKLNISAKEVIDAASTKPFGFQPFYPGPGIGGHCIPVDPMYLSWLSKQKGFSFDLLQLTKEINDNISSYIINKIIDFTTQMENKEILIYGITYKKDVGDIRESVPLKIMESLNNLKFEVSYHDPYISSVTINNQTLHSIPITVENIKKASIVVILTDHSCIPLETIVNHANLIYDTRNVTNKFDFKENIYYFGGKNYG
ncbi:UDP-N-acetyl-D-glucosamine 6-dehydrogenase [Bacillus sp. THAF10]|uniref:nucleotide sugar dehydrogenase n=1 Tax=Bacillus sp. THAF10 TaxID=2587848 RepID=UPI0012684DF4|nr:nucleotide sugar dehydrogenase [Bacillus sp. THAF10]QFT88423.1 UDP-N-acetyl-D-glucosamine 6-dehydrogenase [Bacillus sp. THAF10]